MHIPADTRRHRFAPLTGDDAPFILKLVNEPGWLRHIGDRDIHTLDAARAYIANGPVASYACHGFGLWRVSLLQGGGAIGLCGLIRRDTLEHPDVGYAFLERHGGQGHATETVAAVLAHAAGALALAHLLAITSPDNEASMRVLLKNGFAELPQRRTAESRFFAWQRGSAGIHAQG